MAGSDHPAPYEQMFAAASKHLFDNVQKQIDSVRTACEADLDALRAEVKTEVINLKAELAERVSSERDTADALSAAQKALTKAKDKHVQSVDALRRENHALCATVRDLEARVNQQQDYIDHIRGAFGGIQQEQPRRATQQPRIGLQPPQTLQQSSETVGHTSFVTAHSDQPPKSTSLEPLSSGAGPESRGDEPLTSDEIVVQFRREHKPPGAPLTYRPASEDPDELYTTSVKGRKRTSAQRRSLDSDDIDTPAKASSGLKRQRARSDLKRPRHKGLSSTLSIDDAEQITPSSLSPSAQLNHDEDAIAVSMRLSQGSKPNRLPGGNNANPPHQQRNQPRPKSSTAELSLGPSLSKQPVVDEVSDAESPNVTLQQFNPRSQRVLDDQSHSTANGTNANSVALANRNHTAPVPPFSNDAVPASTAPPAPITSTAPPAVANGTESAAPVNTVAVTTPITTTTITAPTMASVPASTAPPNTNNGPRRTSRTARQRQFPDEVDPRTLKLKDLGD